MQARNMDSTKLKRNKQSKNIAMGNYRKTLATNSQVKFQFSKVCV